MTVKRIYGSCIATAVISSCLELNIKNNILTMSRDMAKWTGSWIGIPIRARRRNPRFFTDAPSFFAHAFTIHFRFARCVSHAYPINQCSISKHPGHA